MCWLTTLTSLRTILLHISTSTTSSSQPPTSSSSQFIFTGVITGGATEITCLFAVSFRVVACSASAFKLLTIVVSQLIFACRIWIAAATSFLASCLHISAWSTSSSQSSAPSSSYGISTLVSTKSFGPANITRFSTISSQPPIGFTTSYQKVAKSGTKFEPILSNLCAAYNVWIMV